MKDKEMLEIIREVFRRSNGAEPYQSYIEKYMAKDFGHELAKFIQQLQAENKELKECLEYSRDFIKDLPELNPSNYNHDDVCQLNSGVCEIYSFIEKLAEPSKEKDV